MSQSFPLNLTNFNPRILLDGRQLHPNRYLHTYHVSIYRISPNFRPKPKLTFESVANKRTRHISKESLGPFHEGLNLV